MVTVRVPASSANLGTGFDTLGLAWQLYFTVKARQVNFYSASKASPAGDLFIRSMQVVFDQAGVNMPVLELQTESDIPAGKGLGSSAAVIVAAMHLANHLCNGPFSEAQLLNLALAIEGHADNITAATAGGLTTAMVWDQNVYYHKVPVQDDLHAVIVVPDFALPTQEARAILPQQVSWQSCVRHTQQACFVMQSLAKGDYRHLALAMDDDIVQASRQSLIPGLAKVLQAAYENGAQGACLSGAGPSVLALATDNLEAIAKAMQAAFAASHIVSHCIYTAIDHKGVRIEGNNV